ncbi:MAG TPA: FMN-binding negative transcriptional regulator [Magnetovibrio sp.]
MASYPPQSISERSLDSALEIAKLCKFATIIHTEGNALTTVHAPLTVQEGGDGRTIVGHLAHNNPLHEVLLAGPVLVRLIFLPTEGYVSPACYAEKARSGKVVPTWNYVAAHIDGELTLASEPGALLRTLALQTADYEGATGGEWEVDDAPSEYIDALARAIVAIRFVPKNGLAIEKLSQNKPDDLVAITDWLETSAFPARSMAYWMKRQQDKP